MRNPCQRLALFRALAVLDRFVKKIRWEQLQMLETSYSRVGNGPSFLSEQEPNYFKHQELIRQSFLIALASMEAIERDLRRERGQDNVIPFARGRHKPHRSHSRGGR